MKKKLISAIPYFVLLLSLTALSFYIYKYNVIFIDSDASSELVLANLLNKTSSIVTNQWYYSTELKIINTNLIFTPLFSLINNWTLVRALGTCLCMLLMALSSIFFYKQLGINKPVILAILALLPISIQYFGMYIGQPSYEFSSIKTYLTLGLILSCIKKNDMDKSKTILIIVLSFIQGLEGARNMILTIFPASMGLLIIWFLIKHRIIDETNSISKKLIIIGTSIMIIPATLAFVINVAVLNKIFSFASFNDMGFVLFGGDTIANVFLSWLKTFGYVEGRVFSTVLIHNTFSIVILAFSIYVVIDNIKKIKYLQKGDLFFTLYYCIAVFVLIFLTVFVHFINSDMERYNLPVAIFAIPLIVRWLEYRIGNKRHSSALFVLFVLIFAICGIDNLLIFKNNNNREVLKDINTGRTNYDTVELNNIVYMLSNDDYKNGYSYFWNGNDITELSNGDIDMWVWGNGGLITKELKDINETYKWLQLKKHDYERPNGKVFLLFTPEELDYSKITNKLEWSNVIYNSENFTIYGYSSYDNLVEDFQN